MELLQRYKDTMHGKHPPGALVPLHLSFPLGAMSMGTTRQVVLS